MGDLAGVLPWQLYGLVSILGDVRYSVISSPLLLFFSDHYVLFFFVVIVLERERERENRYIVYSFSIQLFPPTRIISYDFRSLL